jgi:Flp pilus assembly pilin Flp
MLTRPAMAAARNEGDHVLNAASRVLRGTDGQDLLEYGLLMSLIAVAAVFSVTTLGNTVNSVLWQYIAQTF